MVEIASEPNFENIDLSNPWGPLEFKAKGDTPDPKAIEFFTKFLKKRTLEEAKTDLEQTDALILKNSTGEIIAIRTFTAKMRHRVFDNYKSFSLGEVIVDPEQQKQGIGQFLTLKAIEYFNSQDEHAPISLSIGTDPGAKLAAQIKAAVGERLNVFDSR